ncbi:50S ribosomal protein L4 [Candidatus Falkowbacteria bacterium CG10_big_fil_rev_8_21_14_0_10_43_11]|uniref:Large ribosomal subunit protein uL4 n=1 Tax=Candidatus Falkowbacteria bacterium CG10_big_fil_rev_8_21_14_0_10_43_11 TaxID=1974568 RepID=A0A2M6WLR8_9BACT|nr:MAG: 50S ribosomal protein L4 [Candidatus Falkowbacteria bacterium CG10_big_fil_rev_8_21_14_0_10_43_11]
MKVKVYNQNAEIVGEQDLNPAVFDVKANEALIHQVAVAQMSNERQVLAHTKTKGEVRGGGRKPWRQKGTGRARAGSSRSPLWTGGGVTFGPRSNRNFSKKINIKMKRQAILGVLSDKVRHQSLIIVDKLDLPEAKTKQAALIIKNFAAKTIIGGEANKQRKNNILVMTAGREEKAERALKNLTSAELIKINNINILDLLKYKNIILTLETVKKLEERYSGK